MSWAIEANSWATALMVSRIVVVMVSSLSPHAACAMVEEGPADRHRAPDTGRQPRMRDEAARQEAHRLFREAR